MELSQIRPPKQPSKSPMRPQVGQLVNNKYRLLRLIGDGGMGSVFEARHEALGTTVALKFLHAELTRRPGLVQRFLQEARVVARMESPHVVRVSDVDQTPDGLAFIVMEYIQGKSLQALYEELYRAGKRLSMAESIDYALQMLDGLETAHGAGIVHRDLKPDNVMITKGAKGSSLLKILDFGIAKLKVEGEHMKGLTRPGVVMGTPEYMAPEQAFSADQVDARADIFAFGVMFFEMLAGRRPVGGDEPHQIAAQYLAGEVAKLTDLAPTVPTGLAEVVHKAMSAQAKDRWANVADLRHAIEPFIPASKSHSTVKSDRPVAPIAAAAAALPAAPAADVSPLAAAASPAAGARSVPKTDPGGVDGGATEKSDGLPAMMQGGTAEGLGPGGPPYPPGVGASPAPALSPVAPSPLPAFTDLSSPGATPAPEIIGAVGPGGGWAGTEPAELRPFEPSFTATEGFQPLGVRPGGTDVGAPRVGGTAIDPSAPIVGTAPATPMGGYAAPTPHAPARKKKGAGLGWMLFLATTLTGAVVGAVFLWDRLQLDDGPDPEPIATGAPVVTQLPATPPAPPAANTPAAPTPPATPPPAQPPTQPKPPPTQPKPPPTQPKPPPSQPKPPPTFPTVLPWQTPTVPSQLPPIWPQPTNPNPTVDPPKPRPTFEPFKPRPRPSSTVPPGGGTSPKPPPSGSSRPKLKVPTR